MIMPSEIKIDDLKDTNPEYCLDKIMDYEALYLGGATFRQRKENFLVQRKTDIAYPEQWKERLKRAQYINRAGGIIDWLAAAVFEQRPEYVVKEGASELSREYWEGLNRDADGLGHPISDILIRALTNTLVHKRTYLDVFFNTDEYMVGESTTDGKITTLESKEITDWHHEKGQLMWCRKDGAEPVRNNVWTQADTIRYTWSFYDNENINIYEAYKKENEMPEYANLVDTIEHDFGLPIFEVYAHDCQWVLDRIYDVVVSLFNRDSSVTKYLDDSAFQMLMLKLEEGRNTGGLVMTDLSGIRLNVGEDGAWLAPQNGYFDPLQKDREYLKGSLFEVMQSTAINAAAIPQAGRMSGESVKQMREPLQVLLSSLAYPIYDAWQRVTDALLEHRNEPLDTVELKGFDSFSVTMDDLQEVVNGEDERADSEEGSDREEETDD